MCIEKKYMCKYNYSFENFFVSKYFSMYSSIMIYLIINSPNLIIKFIQI